MTVNSNVNGLLAGVTGAADYVCSCHVYASQRSSRLSCSEARSCGKPDLLRTNSCSCTNPI